MTHNATAPIAQPIATTRHALTFFDDKFASKKYDDALTLPELADEIAQMHDSSKQKLPWLKMAIFGDTPSAKRSYRTNANLQEITGVEIDYDGGVMSFGEAVTRLRDANLRCIIYTSASSTPDKPRWRVLAPTSARLQPKRRAELVAAINGVLGGVIAGESFVLSTAYYYGYVNRDHHVVRVVDGDFIDQRDDLWEARQYKQPRGETKSAITPPTSPGEAQGYDDADITEMLKRCRDRSPDGGGQWHRTMLSVTASLVNKGWSDERIYEITAPYCDDGWGDPDVEALIKGARSKYGLPDPDKLPDLSEAIGPIVAQAIKESGQAAPASTSWRAGQARPRPLANAELAEKVAWLLDHYGYCPSSDTVVELHRPDDDCQIRPVAFQRLFRAWREETEGPRGGVKVAYATAAWEVSPRRIEVTGVRMRPDMPFPVYMEAGRPFKNTYLRPVHDAGGGEVETFNRFLTGYLPDPVERAWLLDWMAHKWIRPWVPGTSIVFVADSFEGTLQGRFGTGRGLMGSIVHRLYGESYSRGQSFAMLDGSSGQSTYNDWLHGSVLVTVDEAKTSPTAYRRGERNAAYEVLKELVDPAPKKHRFNGKYKGAFDGMSYCSMWVATNHANAIMIPEHDRRISVLTNGETLTPAQGAELAAWRDNPANIAALARLLEARDLTGFNMYEPLRSVGKDAMAEMARSDIEDVMDELIHDRSRGLVFTKEHIERLMEHNYNGRGQQWRGEFNGAWHSYCSGLKTENGSYRRVRMSGTQRKLFFFRANKKRVEQLPEAAIRREAAKWGSIETGNDLADVARLTPKDE